MIVGGASSVHIFLYSLFYFVTRLRIEGFVSALIFCVYSLLGCSLFALMTGTIVSSSIALKTCLLTCNTRGGWHRISLFGGFTAQLKRTSKSILFVPTTAVLKTLAAKSK